MRRTGRIGLALVLKAALVLTGVAGASAAPFAYISNALDSTVSVIDTATNTLVGPPVSVGNSGAAGVAVTPDGRHVYVTTASGLSVIDTATNVVTMVSVGSSQGVAVTPDGTRVYVTHSGNNNTVSVIDTATNTVIGSPVVVGISPTGVAVTPDGKRAYVANHGYLTNGNTVSVIDTATNGVVATVTVGSIPYGVAVTPDGTRVYVTSVSGVSVIDTATNTVVGAPVVVGSNPGGVAVTPDGKHVYVASSDYYLHGSVSVIDTATNTVVGAPVPVGGEPIGVAVTPDGTHVYVANYLSNTVSVIDTTTNAVTTVPVGSGPFAFGKFIGGKPDPRLIVPKWFQLGIPSANDTFAPDPVNYPNNFWGSYDYDNETKKNPKTGNIYTIGEEGCALTALIMAINFLSGNSTSPTGYPCSTCSWPGFPPLDPRTSSDLVWPNNWGTALFDGKAQVKWNNFATWEKDHQVRVYGLSCSSCQNTFQIIPNTATPDKITGLYALDVAMQTLINVLRNKVPVILPIQNDSAIIPKGVSAGDQHWVVVTGFDSLLGTFLVNDPGDVTVMTLDTKTDNNGNYLKDGNIIAKGVPDATYAKSDYITQVSVSTSLRNVNDWKVYTNIEKSLGVADPNTPQALGIYTEDPVEFILTDPQGRRTGFDPVSNTTFQEIPTSSYSTSIYSDEQNLCCAKPPFKALDMANQLPGQYTLNVIGIGSGNFTVEVTASDPAGNWITQTYSGTTAPGASSQIRFQGAVITFAAFGANLAISPSHQAFGVDGTFTLGPGGTISPVTQPVTIQLGNGFLVTIPAGSFEQTPQGTFVFGGVIQGVLLGAALEPTGSNSYAFAIAGAGAPNLPSANPVDVRLAIGTNGGSTSVNATFVP